MYQTEKWNTGRGICHQVGNEEIPPLTVGLEDRGGGDRVDTSFLSSGDKGNQESQTVMSGDTILRRELKSPFRESLQMYLSRYVLLLQHKNCSFYKYISKLKQKIPFHKAIFRNMCRQQWAPTYSGHPGFMFKTRSIYLIYFHLATGFWYKVPQV